jgi:hypothetical protein
VDLGRITDERGSLTYIQRGVVLPFEIKRIYYLYDTEPSRPRGAHAHLELEQLMIAVTGSFDVVLDDGRETVRHRLSSPSVGLYVSPMIWRDLRDFSFGAVCLVLASRRFDEGDYVRDYDKFLRLSSV